MNVSNNAIEELPNIKMPQLYSLDLSSNHIRKFPSEMSTKTPKLAILSLNGNPIESLEITGSLSLQKLSLQNIGKLREIREKAFENVTGIKERVDEEGSCLDLIISNCPQLQDIHETAFQNVSFCEVSFKKFPGNLNIKKHVLFSWISVTTT